MEFKYIVILVCFAFTAFLVYKETVRKDRSRLMLRILASILMMFALGALAIPISYTIEKEEPLHQLNLLTTGTNLDSAKMVGEKYILDSSLLKQNKNLKAKFIPDLSYYLEEHADIQQINIYGYGLDNIELQKLGNRRLTFHQTPITNGLVSCNWPQQLKATQQFIVQGTYKNIEKSNIKLVLKGFGKNLDSIETNAVEANFSLKTRPKQIGKAVFQLITLQGKDTLSIDPVPFVVQAANPLCVMMLNAAPGFESRFLKNWLAENQYSVVFRSQISKNKYSYDFFNQKRIALDHINLSVLKNIDVLIVDEEEWNVLPAGERAAIEQSVNSGMGLIVNISEAKAKSASKRFDSYEVDAQHEKPAALKVATDSSNFTVLPFVQNLFLKVNPGKVTLINDNLGRVVVNQKISGLGQVLESTLSSSYQWQLAGKKADYAKFWSALLSTASRREQATQQVQVSPRFTTVGKRSRLVFSDNTNKVPQIAISGSNLHPRQNMELPFEWDVIFWPNELGWMDFNLNKQQSSAFIYKQSDWQTLKDKEKIDQTINFINNQHKNIVKNETITTTLEKEISKWWFLLVFLLTAGYLWYELRVLANK